MAAIVTGGGMNGKGRLRHSPSPSFNGVQDERIEYIVTEQGRRRDFPGYRIYNHHSHDCLYRHSRVSGNPAVACQDCGGIRQYRRDSRLRGNDGG